MKERISAPPLLHVYSNLTLDVTGNEYYEPGGPGYYVYRALETVEVPPRMEIVSCRPRGEHARQHPLHDIVLGECRGESYTVFKLEYSNGARSLRLLRYCGKCCEKYAGDIALVSPVYWETCTHLLLSIPYNYIVTVVDVQGFTRLGTRILYDPRLLNDILHYARKLHEGRMIVKASIEDVGPSQAYELLSKKLLDILTLGEKGSIVRDGSSFYYVKGACTSPWKTGAGDIFSALVAYRFFQAKRTSNYTRLVDIAAWSTMMTSKVLNRIAVAKGLIPKCSDKTMVVDIDSVSDTDVMLILLSKP